MKWYHWLFGAGLAWLIIREIKRKPMEPTPAAAASSQYVSGGSSIVDLSPLASLLSKLSPPNIVSLGRNVSAGTTEIIAAEGGKRITVLAYSITTAGTNDVEFRSNGATLWRQTFDAAAGKTGANLATAFPTRLFAAPSSGNLEINASAACDVSVTYFLEAA